MEGLFNAYRPQSILVLLQTLVILSGALGTRVILKAFGYPSVVYHGWSFPVFVRDWALIFMIIPAGWCYLSVKMEERQELSQRASILTGVIMLALLGWVMLWSVGAASSPHMGPIRVRNG